MRNENNNNAPLIFGDVLNSAHAYDVETNMPDGTRGNVRVYANNRDHAGRIAERAGYAVRSVNMVG